MYFAYMELSLWEKISSNYYTDLLWTICAIFTLSIGFKYYRKDRTYRFLLAYIFINSIILAIIVMFMKYFSIDLDSKGISTYKLMEIMNTIFSAIEISTFFFFFKLVFNTKTTNQIINILWILFISLCIIFFFKIFNNKFSTGEILRNSFVVSIIELLLLVSFCIFYFYTLFTKEITNIARFNKSPSLWIITGLFIYCIISLPFFLIADNLYLTARNIFKIMHAIHYISISFLLLCIAKAFSCETTLTI